MLNKFVRKYPLDVVSLNEAKDQLNLIDFDDDDSLIESLIETSTHLAENYTGRLFSRCTVTVRLTPSEYCVRLPYHDIDLITSVQVDGQDISYEFDSFDQVLTITDTALESDDLIYVVYDAGYQPNQVSPIAATGIKMLISELYNYREGFAEMTVSDLPMTVTKVLGAIRIRPL